MSTAVPISAAPETRADAAQVASLHRLGGDVMLHRWRRTGDDRWRARAIEEYMPLAYKLAKRYHRGREPLEDLQQVAFLGLVKAVDRFDPEFGNRFASFAIPTITGELRRHFRDAAWSVHVPRGLQEDMLRVRQATVALTDRLQRDPTVSELSAETGLDAEEIVEALQAGSATEPTSLDGPVGGRDGDDDGRTLADALGGLDDGFDLVEHRTTIGPLLKALPRRDREMLLLRFAHDMTQSEIAARMGCSQMHVSRVLRRTLDQLSAQSRRP